MAPPRAPPPAPAATWLAPHRAPPPPPRRCRRSPRLPRRPRPAGPPPPHAPDLALKFTAPPTPRRVDQMLMVGSSPGARTTSAAALALATLEPSSAGAVEAGLCFRCLEAGHSVRDCPNEIRCRRCLLSGHGTRGCTPEQRAHDRARARLMVQGGVPRTADTRPAARNPPPPPPPPTHASPTQAPPSAAAAPSTDPDDPVRVIISRSVEIEESERMLQRASVATIMGTRPEVSVDQVEALLCASFELVVGEFSVMLHRPEDFLILFHSKAASDRVSGEHFVSDPSFSLLLRP
ncbi:hypothetical protein QYE76_060182 [Lolium multiflorum]|uniref:CCHC-type domain-containing protein n=1 Tax=Lolium multiflorum TaxID=4521 RepID=A0AAD8W6A0_LOLMU|nr:hypothetical protein QYE76_060182 [Lolium multiflorum]